MDSPTLHAPTLHAPTLHASAVAIDGRGVLIEGAPGAGKSDLALRLIDRGAILVADDAVALTVTDGVLNAGAPDRIRGQIEVRGLGIVTLPHVAAAPVALLVSLGQPAERLPPPASRLIEGVSIPMIVLDAAAPSAAIKVELALRHPEAVVA